MKRKNSTVRDLIDTGIFTVLYFLVASLGMVGLFLGPAGLFITLLGSALLGGLVLLPYFARISTPWVFLGLVAVMCLIMAGHAWTSCLTLIIFGLLATWVLKLERQQQRFTWRSQLAYAVFSLWYVGPLLPMIYMRQAYFDNLASTHDTQWAQAMANIFSIPMVLAFDVFVFILALIGAAIGARLTRNYFKPAGLA